MPVFLPPLFLARLEEQADFTGWAVGQLVEHLGDAQQHGGMGIVPAGVHQAGCARFIRHIVRFLNRQRIHIGADADRRAPFADARHHAGFSHADFNLDAHFAQRIRHQPRRPLLLEAELGMHVNIAPPGDQLIFQRFGFFQHRHRSIL